MKFPWPRSLTGQLLLAIALALFAAQAFNAVLIYRAQAERRDAAVIHAACWPKPGPNRASTAGAPCP